MGQTLRESMVGCEGDIDTPADDQDVRDVASWLDCAVDAAGKAGAVAAALGISSSRLSDICSGARSMMSIVRLYRWLKGDQRAALAFVNAMCLDFGLKPTVVGIDHRQVKRRAIGMLAQMDQVRRKLANEFDCDTAQIQFLLDEKTDGNPVIG